MKKLAVISLVMSMGLAASAVLVASDGFDYSTGSIDGKNGGSGFSGAWSSPTAEQVTSNSLSQIGLPTVGNKLEMSDSTVTRAANFTDFNFNVNATNYVSLLVNKGGTASSSGEFLKAFITASSGVISGFEIRSDEKVRLELRGTSVTSTESIDVNTEYLFLMKMITSTTSSEHLYLTWFKAGDALPENDGSVAWKLSTFINNNGVSSNTGLKIDTGANITATIDEFKMGTKLSDVVNTNAVVQPLTASERFEYPVGAIADQDGGSGFTGAWAGSTNGQVISGSLPDLANMSTAGNKLEITDGTFTRAANFPDFNFNVNATKYVSLLVNKGGTASTSGEFFKAFITASSGVISGFEIRSDEKVRLELRTTSVTSTEPIDVNTDYLFLMKMITSTTSSEHLYLTWFKAGDALPEDDDSVAWKLSTSINNNTISSNTGLELSVGSAITAIVDEFKIGSNFSQMISQPPPFVTIVDWSFVPGDMMKMTVDLPGAASNYAPVAVTDLASGTWTNVPHSDNGVNAFVITNLDYSSVDTSSNKVIYVRTDDASKFFDVVGHE